MRKPTRNMLSFSVNINGVKFIPVDLKIYDTPNLDAIMNMLIYVGQTIELVFYDFE